MADKLLFGINRVIAWLAFGDETNESGIVVNSNDGPGYRASRNLPAYASNDQAAQSVIEHFERGGAKITFTELSDGWTCDFVPSEDDVDWTSATATAKRRPLALCLSILKAAGDIPTIHNRMPSDVAEFLRQESSA
jgi:hypothetical protein